MLKASDIILVVRLEELLQLYITTMFFRKFLEKIQISKNMSKVGKYSCFLWNSKRPYNSILLIFHSGVWGKGG